MFGRIKERCGRLDILVNNAAMCETTVSGGRNGEKLSTRFSQRLCILAFRGAMLENGWGRILVADRPARRHLRASKLPRRRLESSA